MCVWACVSVCVFIYLCFIYLIYLFIYTHIFVHMDDFSVALLSFFHSLKAKDTGISVLFQNQVEITNTLWPRGLYLEGSASTSTNIKWGDVGVQSYPI